MAGSLKNQPDKWGGVGLAASPPSDQRRADQRRERLICALGAVLFAMGGSIFYVQPAFSAAFGSALRLSARDVGMVDSLETASLAFAAIVMAIAPGRFGLKLMMVSAATVACGNLLSGLMPNVYALAALRCFTGLIGEGPLSAYAFVILGRMARPERGFGVASTLIALCGTLALQPSLQAHWAGYGASLVLFAVLVVPAIALLYAVIKLPATGEPHREGAPSGSARSGERHAKTGLWAFNSITLRLLVGQAIWAAAPGLLWPFTAQMAGRSGLGGRVELAALSMSTIFGLSGIVIPAVLGKNANYRTAICAASVGLAGAACLIFVASSLLALAAGFALFIVFWNMGQIYQPALLLSVDRSGRGASLIPVVQLAGMAAGTALGGLAIQRWGIPAIPISCVAALALSTPLLVAWSAARLRHERLVGDAAV
jgi:predicted MFS family arabinose efflux permease